MEHVSVPSGVSLKLSRLFDDSHDNAGDEMPLKLLVSCTAVVACDNERLTKGKEVINLSKTCSSLIYNKQIYKIIAVYIEAFYNCS